MNKKTRISQTTNNTYNWNSNANIPQWSEARSSENGEIGMTKCRRKNVDIINEEVKVISSELEETKILKCTRKNQVDIIKEETKESSIK